jgi:hypothetical protein
MYVHVHRYLHIGERYFPHSSHQFEIQSDQVPVLHMQATEQQSSRSGEVDAARVSSKG